MGSAALDALRAKLREIEGGAPIARRRPPSGVSAIDALLGGLPRPGVVEVVGPLGAGRSRLATALVAAVSRSRWVAWVDPLRRLYPPALAAEGVDLERLLIVRPPEDGQEPWQWAAEQLLRSGCFEVVVVDRPDEGAAPRRPVGARWARAAEHGQSCAWVLGERPAKSLAADVRLAVGGGRVTRTRDRSGGGGVVSAPLPERRSDPWGAACGC